jgi:acyl-CoA reductase-like NAD-dependent aldehyde dehydrogenase
MSPHAVSPRGRTDAVLTVRNPGTGEEIDTVPISSRDAALRAVEAAQEGKRAMAALPAYERAALLTRVADGIERRAESLSALLASENGKPIRQTREEVAAAARIFRGFAGEATRLFGRQIPLDAVPGLERHLAITLRRPRGVVAALVPFNYPVELYAHKAAAALAAGNAVIVKPPDKCPLTVIEIADIVREAGAPANGHQVVNGGVEVAQLLSEVDGVDAVSLTGGTAAGRVVAELAARTLKHLHLELGGNDALIVCGDADVARAVEAVVLGRLARGNGQICCAVKRVYVQDAVYDEFAQRLESACEELVVGDQLAEGTDVGPLITEAAATAVHGAVRQAVDGGARLVAGGERRGTFVTPTVLTDVDPAEEAIAKEIFGPVAPLLRVTDPFTAADLANRSPYGLQAAVFSNDINQAFAVANRLHVGSVIINGSTAIRAENLPFGGTKLTGGSREGIHDTALEFTEQKTVIVLDALR